MTKPTARRLRLTAWVLFACALVVGQMVWLFLISGRKIFYVHRSPLVGPQLPGFCLIGVWFLLKSTPADAIRLSSRTSRIIIISITVLLQAASILLLLPALNEDLVRDRLDARTWLSGVSPYSVSPAEMRKRALTRPKYALDVVDELVSSPEVHTTHGPVAEAAFVLAGWTERAVRRNPVTADPPPPTWPLALMRRNWTYHALAFRALAALCAVGCCLVLLRMLRLPGASPWWAILFAWNPLTTFEAAGMGHVDFLGVLLLLLALHAARQRRAVPAMLLLALAAGVNALAIPLAPLFVWHAFAHGRRKAAWASAVTFLAALAALYVPILLYHKGYAGWIAGWRDWLAKNDIGVVSLAIRALLILVATMIVWRLRKIGLFQCGYWLVLAILLILPMEDPACGAWLICFVPFLPDPTPAGATGAAWSAATWGNGVNEPFIAIAAIGELIIIRWERRRLSAREAAPSTS